MKIDIYSHFCPKKYKNGINKLKNASKISYELKLIEACPALFDLDKRLKILEKYDCCQVLTVISPPIEDIADSDEALDLAKIANDEIAELLVKYPESFIGGAAVLPLNDLDASLMEIDRAINELKLRGIQIHTSIKGKPIDSPEFFPIFEKMVKYNLPIFLHPWRTMNRADYDNESQSLYKIWSTFGWPYETSAAMTRLVFGGIFEKLPSLKIITHHAGGMIPFFAERIRSGYDLWEMRTSLNPKNQLTNAPMEYFSLFFADTAIAGHRPGLMCAYDFFGPDHLLFGTDMPMDSQTGFRLVRDTIEALKDMDIPETDKTKIFEKNAKKLLRLPV